MVTDKPGKWRKMIVISSIVGAVLICLAAIILLLTVTGSVGPTQPNSLNLTFAGNGVISDDQLSATRDVLQSRFDALGYGASVTTMRDASGNGLITIHYGNVSADKMAAIATTPGKIEMRIQTAGNQSEHILYGDDISHSTNLVNSSSTDEFTVWTVPITLKQAGAEKFRQACIGQNATSDPENHHIMMLLDSKVICSLPLSEGLAAELASHTIDTMMVNTGRGADGEMLAAKFCSSIAGGKLPVPLRVSGT